MANCPSCDADVAPDSRWCRHCGRNVIEPAIGRLASPARRLVACLLDLIVPIFLLTTLYAALRSGATAGSDASEGAGVLIGIVLLNAYVIWNMVLFARATTPGKELLGMRVVREDGRDAQFLTMLLREWPCKLISGLVLGLGLTWILFDPDNQGWHDKLMCTYVVRELRWAPSEEPPRLVLQPVSAR